MTSGITSAASGTYSMNFAAVFDNQTNESWSMGKIE